MGLQWLNNKTHAQYKSLDFPHSRVTQSFLVILLEFPLDKNFRNKWYDEIEGFRKLLDHINLIDTHEDNQSMQKLLAKNQFSYCGIIYLSDGSKRLAFEKVLI